MNIPSIVSALAFGVLVSFNVSGQGATSTTKPGLESVKLQSSAICDMCEKTIEENMIYEKGVKSVDVDLAASIIHVEYDARKTDPQALRTAVTKLGYAADDMLGDPVAFKKLPDCCQKEGCGQPAEKKEGE